MSPSSESRPQLDAPLDTNNARNQLEGQLLTCLGKLLDERRYNFAAEYQGSYIATIGHFIRNLRFNHPFETSPEDNLEALRLVKDCNWHSSREAA